MSHAKPQQPKQHGDGSFVTTRWSLVVRACGETAEARRALDELCRIYWYPLYCYIRRRSHQHTDAEDLVQGFFLRLLEKDFFGQADREKGRLRGFLLSSLQFHLVDEQRRTSAEKRGGGVEFVPLDTTGAEERYRCEPIATDSPEKHFDRRWATTVLNRALAALAAEWPAEKRPLFDALMPHLLAPLAAATNRNVARQLGLTENHIKVSLHRLRRRYREVLRAQVAETVETEAEIDEELAALSAATQ